MTRTRRVQSQEEKERAIDDLLTRGYKLKHRGQYMARLKEKDYGELPYHVLVFVLMYLISSITFNLFNLPVSGVWVVIILSNIAYAGYSWYTAEEIIVKIDADSRD